MAKFNVGHVVKLNSCSQYLTIVAVLRNSQSPEQNYRVAWIYEGVVHEHSFSEEALEFVRYDGGQLPG